jgi:hypothetical protein
MKLPESIEVSVKADGQPLEGVLVRVCILTTSKNNFHSQYGPTDDNGRVLITRAALLAEAKRDQELFVMDYGDPEINFAGVVEVSIFGKDDLSRAIDAYALFKDVEEYPPDYLRHLQRAQEILDKLADAKILIDVVYEKVQGVEVRTASE